MRSSMVCCSGLLAAAACGVEPSTTIAITFDRPPMLVAFRDRFGSWQASATTSPTTFEASVHGPYVVAVVCELNEPESTATLTQQFALTLDDPHDIKPDCGPSPALNTVTGRMIQPGLVRIEPESDSSSGADWGFSIAAEAGTHDLVASSYDDHLIMVVRDITVNGDVAVTPELDLAQDGAALVDVAFTVPNAARDDRLEASVGLFTATARQFYAEMYLDSPAPAKVAPEAALVASDIQSVSLRAYGPEQNRALRRPFRIGDDTSFVMPARIGGLAWSYHPGRLQVNWVSLPQLDNLSVSAACHGPARDNYFTIDVSPSFLATTRNTYVLVDVSIPGYDPAWRFDYDPDFVGEVRATKGTATATLATTWSVQLFGDRPTGKGAGTLQPRITRLLSGARGAVVSRLPGAL